MSTKKLEKVLELMISEESDKASDLLHDIFVEKSRKIYAGLIDEDNIADLVDDDDFDELDAEYIDDFEGSNDDEFGLEDIEDFDDEDEIPESDGYGTDDEQDDFISDVEADEDEIDSEEYFSEDEDEEAEEDLADDLVGDEEYDETDVDSGEESDVEEKFMDVDDALADLRAEFDRLVGDDTEDDESDEFTDEMDDEDFEDDSEEDYDESDEDEDEIEESADLSKVDVKNKGEDADNTESPVAKSRGKDGKPHPTDTKEESGRKAPKAKDHGVKGPQEQGGKIDRHNHEDEIK